MILDLPDIKYVISICQVKDSVSISRECAGHRDYCHRPGACLIERPRTFGNGAPRCVDIVKKNNPFPFDQCGVSDGKGTPHIADPFCGGEPDLGVGPADAAEVVAAERNAPVTRQDIPQRN